MSGRHLPGAQPVFRVCAALLLVTAGVLLGAAPAGASPSLTVTPSTALTDGQVVNVEVTGFDPDLDVALTVVQCNPEPRSIDDCDEARTWDALALQPDGTGSAPFRVHVLPGDGGGDTVRCDRTRSCVLAVLSDPEDFTARMAVAPISFAGGSEASTTSTSATHTTATGARGTVPAAASGTPEAGPGSALGAPSGTAQPPSLMLPAPLASTGAEVQLLLLGLGSALGTGGLLVQRRALRARRP